MYWGLTALHLLGHPDALPRDEVVDFVLSCQHESGGFGAAPGHDAHMLYTVSAVQILVLLDAVGELDRNGKAGKDKVGSCMRRRPFFLFLSFFFFSCASKPGLICSLSCHIVITNLQDPTTGTFKGDEWGETDTRFLYGAFNALSLLSLLHLVDVDKAVAYIQSCANFDGGYGMRPGAESHGGQILTCVGALAIADRLDLVDRERLCAWLSERQTDGGGLNGRPGKKEDVCYSWWVAGSLAMLGRLHWIDGDKLASFILRCQVRRYFQCRCVMLLLFLTWPGLLFLGP